jgi:hypothetical protein
MVSIVSYRVASNSRLCNCVCRLKRILDYRQRTQQTHSCPCPIDEPTKSDRQLAGPKDLGRGGAEHLTIQERLQEAAHKLGFMAEVEKQLRKGSNQAADIVLRYGKLAIAVEIAVTTTTDHEFENVQKCLAAGFDRIAVISSKRTRLEAISAAVAGGLGSETAKKVTYHTPDEFIAELERIATQLKTIPAPALPPGEHKSHGRTIRRHLPKLSPEEQRQRDEVLNKMLTETLQSQK